MPELNFSLFNTKIFGRAAAYRWRLLGRDAYGNPIVASVPVPTEAVIEQKSRMRRKDDGNSVIERKVTVLSFDEIALGDIVWFGKLEDYYLPQGGVWKTPPDTSTITDLYEVTEIEDTYSDKKGAAREWSAELYEKPFPATQ